MNDLLRITEADLVDGWYKEERIDHDGDVIIDCDMKVRSYMRVGGNLETNGILRVCGSLWAEGHCLSADDVDVDGDIEVGEYVWVDGHLRAGGDVHSRDYIRVRDYLLSHGYVWTGEYLRVRKYVEAGGYVRADDCIDVGGSIETGQGISAVGSLVVGGAVGCGKDYAIRVMPYPWQPVGTQATIRCERLVSGIVESGRLEEVAR
jgi:predicted acyltransferase (DUF342 family)